MFASQEGSFCVKWRQHFSFSFFFLYFLFYFEMSIRIVLHSVLFASTRTRCGLSLQFFIFPLFPWCAYKRVLAE